LRKGCRHLQDKSGKDGEAGNALALSMQQDEARRSCNQKMATKFMKSALARILIQVVFQ